jgi:hypothetical protein
MKLFIQKIVHNKDNKEALISIFKELWDLDKTQATKILFFIVDQLKEHTIFLTLFEWVRTVSPNTFYNNISHLVGISNTKTLPDTLRKQMTQTQDLKHDDILKSFVCPDYQLSFRRSLKRTLEHQLVNSLGIPIYSSWEFMVKLYNTYKDIDNRATLIILNTFDKQINSDKLNCTHSEALKALHEDTQMSTRSRHGKTQSNSNTKGDIKETQETFTKRYAFIYYHF